MKASVLRAAFAVPSSASVTISDSVAPAPNASELNRSFVQMQYFGYLRRNPNDSPDGNFAGYDFWVSKLTAAGGNFVDSDMVKAFITSNESDGASDHRHDRQESTLADPRSPRQH